MTYEELMADLGARLELDEFQPDEDGLCEIHTDDFTVTFQGVPETDMVLTTGLLCELGPDPSAKFLRRLLEANFMYAQTHGATISVDAANDCVMLTRYDRLNQVDGEIFLKTVKLFMLAMAEWKTWFKEEAPKIDKPEGIVAADDGVLRV